MSAWASHLRTSTTRLSATLLLGIAACAHLSMHGGSPPPVVHFQDDNLGVSVDLPAADAFHAGKEPGVLAQASDSTEVRLFVEFVSGQATEEGCWQQLFMHVPADLSNRPHSAAEFEAQARHGMVRGERVVFFSAAARDSRCYVAVVDGPRASKAPADAEAAVTRSMRIGTPSAPVASDFELKAGAQALTAREYAAALRHFEKAMEFAPDSLAARYGAGLAAYFSGPAQAAKAIELFKPVLDARGADMLSEGPPRVQQEQFRDALMYTGLAYASLHEYDKAADKLEELETRYPDDGTARYNLACVFALANDPAGAIGELREAFKRDPALIAFAKGDGDLRSLHSLRQWKVLVGSVAVPRSH